MRRTWPMPLLDFFQHLFSQGQSSAPAPTAMPASSQMIGSMAQNQPKADPYDTAVKTAMQRYPWLRTIGAPIKLTTGKGPYMSESYMPHAEENPHPGNFTVELRHPRLINDPSSWPALIGREGMDYMARHDPTFQSYASQFQKTYTQPQLDRARERYGREQQTHGETRTFGDFLKGAENQEYLGGYVFDEPNWRNAGWTPQQRKLLDGLKNYMWQGQTPTPVKFPEPK